MTMKLHRFWKSFLGNSPNWFKLAIISFLVINPILFQISPYVAGWVLLVEFIFTLAMALKCYPLQSGGLLAIEAILIGMTDVHTWWHEVESNLEVIMLLAFMVAAIYFLKNSLALLFIRLFLKVRSKVWLSVIFSFSAAILSAFLDALTVTAVIIGVVIAFHDVFHKFSSGVSYELTDDEVRQNHPQYERGNDAEVQREYKAHLDEFRSFLRSLLMHAAVGTALGGVMTKVGEPQNLALAEKFGLDFVEFVQVMLPVTLPVLVCGLITCLLLEVFRVFGYGQKMPEVAREILTEYAQQEDIRRTPEQKKSIIVQVVASLILVVMLATHWASVGLIGLVIIALVTAFDGKTDEHQLGPAFHEGLPFTGLLIFFFVIIAVIHDQHLFEGIMGMVLSLPESAQPIALFMEAGALSTISDNVFVALVNLGQVLNEFGVPDGMTVREALAQGSITQAQHDHLLRLTIAINTGTNLPSVLTPNGQAAFLFLLTSSLAPLVKLDYSRMFKMAFPYFLVLAGVGAWCVYRFI
jgi:NhaB family Na+:H+ antiporter